MRRTDPVTIIKPLVFFAALLPAASLVYRAIVGRLGVNPVETIEHFTGDWALYLLLATLAITPLRRLTGWGAIVRLRRMLGLFCFFYATLHFSAWLVFDHFFDVMEMAKDIRKRPYVTVGFSAFVLLIPLALTSTNGMVKRLGGGRWKRLHSLVYVVGTLVILHYLWLVKKDTYHPVLYGVILVALLVLRAPVFQRPRRRPPPAPTPVPAAATIGD
ncbi:MAG: Protein-methionine-sulfoxide reductase heme-binding subunit MsrQ [Gammaproteobacteria bacterium]|nr:Protein-methionine-sulfoxide reductase heme-binding subunit MsrQ [Gammaproteobacteria bacterium]